MSFSRSTGIGGSDVAAILGLSPYRTQFDVWLEKSGDPSFTPQEESPQMRLGRLMEPVLAKVYEEDHPGTTVILRGGFDSEPIWHPNKVVYAHIDGSLGEGIWEGKTAWDDRDWSSPDHDGLALPDYYETQVRTYLAVTGEPFCDVTVFFRQSATFHHIRVEADPELDNGLITLAERWWQEHVVAKEPPDVDGSEGASRFLAHRYPRQTEEALVASPGVDALGQQLGTVRFNIKESEQAKASLENAIKAQMGEFGSITGTGWSASWRRSKGATTVGWQHVASAYRGLLHQIGQALARGDTAEALKVLTDNHPDVILGLYTTTGAGSRPFVYRERPKEVK